MKKLDELNYVAIFSWTEYLQEPVTVTDFVDFDEYGNELMDSDINWRYKYHEEELDKVFLLADRSQRLDKNMEVKGNGVKTAGGKCLFELAFEKETAIIEIGGDEVSFQCVRKENIGEDTLVLHMTPVENKEFMYMTEEGKNEYEKMKKEADKKNKATMVKVEEEIKKKKLQDIYYDFSFLKRLLGGSRLKKQHFISAE